MKKLLLFVIACTLGLFGTVRAQETITIGGDSELRSYSVPFDLYNGYGVCQQLYTADEIGKAAGSIESLALKFVGPTTSDMQTPANQDQVVVDFEIYVENTTMTTLSSYQVVETADLYFSGKTPLNSNDWTAFEFSNSFEYDGTNLLVTIYCVGDKYEMKTDNNYYPFYIYQTADVQCLSASPSAKPVPGTSFSGLNENSGKTVIQFTFAAAGEGGETPTEPVAPAAPANVVATANGQNSIVVTWDAVEGATDYYVYKDGQMWANTSGATTYTENGLSAGTEYCFAVQTVAGDLESELSETKCATTEAEVEEPTEPEQPGGEYASSFAFDFENAALDGWRVFQGSGASSNNWKIGSGAYYGGQSGGYGVYSISYGSSSLVAKNYIVTTEPYAITEESVLSWWIKHTWQGYELNDPYAVVVSTDGENFEQIADYTPGIGVTEQLSLAEYAGQNLYIGFYHYGVGGDGIVLDNITLTAGEGGEEPTEPETPVAPAAPVVAATATETTITLTWEAVENATSYNIYTPSSFSSNVFGLTETTYTFENLTAGEYCFQVSAVNDVDESDATEVCATIEAPVVEEPAGEMCVIDITLEDSYGDGWNGNVLKVEYGTTTKEFTLSNGKTATETMEIPSGSHVTATFICTSAYGYPQENGFTIAYESGEVIVSVDKNTYAMNTPVTQAYEFDLDCTPKAPATPVVKAVATGGSTIALTITSAGAESYNIYNGTETVATGVTENPYTVEGLTAATEYCFTVVAVNGVGNSEASEAACATTFAEGTTIVTIGDGDIAQMSAPIYNAGPGAVYSLSQQIYTAEEIGLEGNVNIYSISFHHATGNNNARDIVVYLTNVEKELYEGNYDWAAFSEEDIVYQDVFNFGQAEDWVTIEFQNAFEYTGGNIAVTVYDKTGSGYGYTYDICDKFYSYQVNEWRGMYYTKTSELDLTQYASYYATSMNTGSWGSPANAYYINNVKFRALATEGGEEPTPEPVAPAAPANVVATANGMNSIVLTWDAVEGATDYYVYKDGQMWANTNGATTTYTENGLTMGTEYCFAVQTVAGDLESELSEQVCATTESLPENQILVGEATTSYYAPFFTILSSSERWFEAIYKADEIGKAGRIGEIAFSYNQGSETAADIKIYLAEVTKSVFESPADLTPATDLTLVYTGTNVTLCDSAWETFVLDTPFNYGGEKNLLLVVVTTNTSLSNKWNCYTDANTALIKDAMLDNRKPVMMLTLVEGGDEPIVDAKYRLVSTGDNTYVYESETSDKVIEIREGQDWGYGQYITFLQYDENGVVTGYEYGWAENGAIVKTGSNYQYTAVEYTYTDGVVTSYTETKYTGWSEPDETEYTITRDAEGNITEVAYGLSKLAYTYENGKLASETKSYYDSYYATYVTEYIIEFAYDENGNCTAATQYSEYDGEKVARKSTEYNYETTIAVENVVAFAYPHAVVPAHANLITRAISYYFNEDWQTNEIVKSVDRVNTYVYDPEVEMEPLAPMALTVSAMSDTELRLSWYSAEEAEKFFIYKDGEFFAESASDVYYAEGLTPATEYCFSVSAVNGETESPKSEVVCGKTFDLVAFYPTAEFAFGEVRVGNYWTAAEKVVSVEIDPLGKTVTSITSDNAFFTVPADIDLTSNYIMFDLGYDKTAAAGEYTGNIVVTLEGGATVTTPVTATAYAPVTPDVFELAQEITFTEGVYTDTPDFATLHDDYLMPEESEWEDGELMDAVYTFTLETPAAVAIKVTGENAQYAIYQAEGFEYPTENTYAGVDRAITTEFSFDFNDGELGAFTIEDYDEFQDYSWDVEDDENGGYKLTSYSYQGWWGEDNSWQYYADADERIITNAAYNITEKSVLTFNMNVNGSFESVIVEVTKDGETFTAIETVGDNSYSYEWLAKRVNIGEIFAELGLEYGEYRISLHHDVQGCGQLDIDNLVLAEREIAFQEGTYFLFAAAEKDLAVEVIVSETEEVVIVPDPKAYRLESVVSFMETVYTYDEVFTNRVVEMVEEGITTTLSYNKAGQVVSAEQVVVYEGEEGEMVEEVLSSIEYTYNEDGTLATYTETAPTPTGAMATTVTEYTYEDGRLAKVENADYEIEMTYVYNEDGTVKEIVEPYAKTLFTYEDGKLVKTTIGWDDEETGEFFAEAEEVYTYANGNVVKQESYEYGSLYQVHEFFYDATISAEDVYTFELPHMAIASVEPTSSNVLVKELSYYSYYDEEAGETFTHSYVMTVYNYNPAIEMAPVTPINFAAEVVDGVVELTWEALADAETFTVYQDGEAIAENLTEGFYAVEGLAEGEYCFAVRAYNAAGSSKSTEDACVTIKGDEPIVPEPTVPAAPVVRVKEVTATTVILEWDVVEGATKYALYSGDEKLGELAETIAGVQALEPETTYCFTVTAINEAGESEHSEEVCATTLAKEAIAENEAAFNIYPNPAVDRVVIETEATIEAVTIYTLTGVMVYSEVDFNNNTINVSDFASGVYVMKVRTENGEVVKRFIKK